MINNKASGRADDTLHQPNHVYTASGEGPLCGPEQRVAYALVVALRVYTEEAFGRWAHGWLSGRNRSASAAWAAWKLTDNARPSDGGRDAARAAARAAWSLAAAYWAENCDEGAARAVEFWAAQAVAQAVAAKKDIDLLGCAKGAGLVSAQ